MKKACCTWAAGFVWWRGGCSARRLLVLVSRLAVSLRLLVGAHQMRLLAGLDGMFRAGRDLFATVLLFLLDFFVVGDVAWVGHEGPVVLIGSAGAE